MTRRSRTTVRLGAAVLLAVLAAACGDGSVGDDDDAAPDPTAGGETDDTVAAAECPGEPLRFVTFAALTGAVSGAAENYRVGTDAALHRINGECSLGRPIEVEYCDDRADVNGSLACGREAAEDGSLAVLSFIGSFDDGVTASGLPGIYLWGTSAYELTNENAYSSISGVTIGMSGVSAVKARGASEMLLVLPDSPALQFVATQVEELAQLLDVQVETIYFPVDTTDYAPIAAQISERDPESIGMLPISPVIMINALAAEGITPETHIMSMASIVLTPEVVAELGSALDGMLVISQTVPPTDAENEGIAEFRADMEAIGEDPDDPTVTFGTVVSWSNLVRLEAALLAAAPEVIESLDSASLVDAIVDHPIDRPESAPYDFRENQISELPDLASFRVFTRDVVILELQDGEYQVLSDGFVDMLDPPDLE
jgi:hypothetical protein